MRDSINKGYFFIGRYALLVAVYTGLLLISLVTSLLLRFDFNVDPVYWHAIIQTALWLIPVKLLALSFFRQFRTLMTYFSIPDAERIGAAMGFSAIFALVMWIFFAGAHNLPRGVLMTDMMISCFALIGFRLGLRVYREKLENLSVKTHHNKRRRTAIIGAGSAGSSLLRDIQGRQGLGMDIVCFFDDDSSKVGSYLHGKPIVGPTNRLADLANVLELNKVIIAMPMAKPEVIRSLVKQINKAGLDHDILPSVTQLLHRQVTVTHLRHVDPEDLLGRDAVPLDQGAIAELLRGQVVLVTGAGGSIGSELCRQIATLNPAKLILIERSEPALFAIEQELQISHPHIVLVPCASSVCDEISMNGILRKYRPIIIFHAAAHKHVPLMESQPFEALLNNALGTELMARLAGIYGVREFILVSTDKAVNPTSVMGACKRLAEMIIEEKQKYSTGCAYAAVRFGNVLGSSGSVIPTFRHQIAKGGPVTVTHPEITRYFMSIPEAVGLVLQCAILARGGEIFVLDMGEPVKIVELARQMIELSGFTPGDDIKITYTGLRAGEKLYEEPIHQMENVEKTGHPKIRLLRNNRSKASGLAEDMLNFYQKAACDNQQVRIWLATKIPEYVSTV